MSAAVSARGVPSYGFEMFAAVSVTGRGVTVSVPGSFVTA